MNVTSGGTGGKGTMSTTGVTKSWASILGQSLAPSLNKNVLEVTLEKDSRGGFTVSDLECSNLLRRLGLDQRPGVHLEEVQVCPNGRGGIFITLKKEVDIGRFCRHDVLDVTPSGIRAVHVKPAGRREVVVSVKGVHPNTREEVVLDYLAKFGKVMSNKVIYSVYPEGPLKGLRNGDRNYKMEIKPSTPLGSYHVLDGNKVSLRYPGQQQTCARCLEPAKKCKGNGVAKRCELGGGVKADFTSYILNLWESIGYSPSTSLSDDVGAEHDRNLADQQDGGTFTPAKCVSETNKFAGVSIKGIPQDTDQGKVVELLVESGLDASKTEKIAFTANGTVNVRELDNDESLALIEALHGKKIFDRKVFCNGIIPLTPEKADAVPCLEPGIPLPPETQQGNTPNLNSCPDSLLRSPCTVKPLPLENILQQESSPQPRPKPTLSCTGPAEATAPGTGSVAGNWESHIPDWSEVPNDLVVRRHSISLSNRTPPRGSLASELLGSQLSFLKPNKSVMSSIKDIQEVLSEFNSCNSTLESSTSEASEDSEDAVGKRKRKTKKLPGRDHFLKKANRQVSPK